MRILNGWFLRGFHPLSGVLLLFGLLGWATGAQAGNFTAYPCSAPANTSIQLADVSVPAGAANGPVGSPFPASISFDCSAAFSMAYNNGGNAVSENHPSVTVQAGMLAALDPSGSPSGGGILFAVTGAGVSGIALKLTASPNQASAANGGPNGTAGWEVGTATPASTLVTVNFTAQLMKTGPVTPGTINGVTLAQFTDYNAGYTGVAPYFASLSIAAGTKVTVPSCSFSVLPSSTIVLPTVSTNALPSGKTAGTTAFSIALSGCSTGVIKARANFGPGAAIDPSTGNLKNISGSAANVQLQLLNGAGSLDAPAGSAINLGAPNGAQNSGQYGVASGAATMNYYARYIANGAAAGAGSVITSVDFTIDYP